MELIKKKDYKMLLMSKATFSCFFVLNSQKIWTFGFAYITVFKKAKKAK